MAQPGPNDRVIFSGRTYARHKEAVDAYHGGKIGARSGKSAPPLDGGLVYVRNNTEESVPRFGILGLGDPIIVPDDNLTAFKNQIAFEGEMPGVSHVGKFVICLEPLRPLAIGAAMLLGVVVCQVSFATGAETAADVLEDDVTQLLAGASGAAQILWAEGGTGTKWAYVKLGGASASSVIQYGMTDTPCTFRGSCGVIPLNEFYEESGEPNEGVWDAHLVPGESLEAGTTVHYTTLGTRKQIISAACMPVEAPGGTAPLSATSESYRSQNESMHSAYSGGGGQTADALAAVFDPSIFSGVATATLA